MLMLARAQSLSGRPHDALVMLQRLAAMGVATDAATNDDFRFVRALPAWAEFEAKICRNASAGEESGVSSPEGGRTGCRILRRLKPVPETAAAEKKKA